MESSLNWGTVEGGTGQQIFIPSEVQTGVERHLDQTTSIAPK